MSSNREFIIYCDESIKDGSHFSNFYGGALVDSKDLAHVTKALSDQKKELNLFNEVKWSKITEQYLPKYLMLVDVFFALIAQKKLKIRIMFTQNTLIPKKLDSYQKENEYFLLYYQFIKHSFGLIHANTTGIPINLRIYLDSLPDTREKRNQFKSYLFALNQNPAFKKAKVQLLGDQIAEINSHEHVIAQYLDIVLGAMQFRLNKMHLAKANDEKRRGRKTVAKEKAYKHIYSKISSLYEDKKFNIGITTGLDGELENRWHHPYRHWLFKASSE